MKNLGRRSARADVQSTWTVLEARAPHKGFRAYDIQVAEDEPEPMPDVAAPVLIGLIAGLRAATPRPERLVLPLQLEASPQTCGGTTPDGDEAA